jgi:hypothetical protein
MIETAKTKTSDRFDLEQQILDCWKITDDLKLVAVKGEHAVEAVATLYELKFEQLWSTFESMVHERKM